MQKMATGIPKPIGSNKGRNMHESMRFMLILAQIFSMVPLGGVRSKDPLELTWKWLSLRTLYTSVILSMIAFVMVVTTYHFMFFDWTFYQMVGHIFSIAGCITVMLFYHLSKHWASLMIDWCKMDEAMEANYGYPKRLDRRLKVTACVLMFLASVEHLLSLGYHAEYTCKVSNGTLSIETYFKAVFPSVFKHIRPTIFTAVIAQLSTFYGTFFWNYNDLFIIILSSAMAIRFKQVTERMLDNRHQVDLAYWMEVRQDYDRLAHLNRQLDGALSYLILHSFAINLIFILVQLFFSLSVWKNNIKMIYFFYSFGFLIARTVAVSLYGAWINDESIEPVHILNSLPSHSYNNEVKRFLMHINSDTPVLTGWKMFKITRGLILNIAGAIVTYELVLIQFNLNKYE